MQNIWYGPLLSMYEVKNAFSLQECKLSEFSFLWHLWGLRAYGSYIWWYNQQNLFQMHYYWYSQVHSWNVYLKPQECTCCLLVYLSTCPLAYLSTWKTWKSYLISPKYWLSSLPPGVPASEASISFACHQTVQLYSFLLFQFLLPWYFVEDSLSIAEAQPRVTGSWTHSTYGDNKEFVQWFLKSLPALWHCTIVL